MSKNDKLLEKKIIYKCLEDFKHTLVYINV